MTSSSDSSSVHLPWETVDDAAPGKQAPTLEPLAEADDDARPLVVLADLPAPAPRSGAAWTLPLLCLGIAIIACCVLIPLCDDTRRMAYEKQRLQQELNYVTRQVAVNDQFIKKVAGDPTLAERLAQRQMNVVPAGSAMLHLGHDNSPFDVSPFQLVHLAPPPPPAPYRPLNDLLSRLCLQPKSQLYLLGSGMMLIAMALILGEPKRNYALAARPEE